MLFLHSGNAKAFHEPKDGGELKDLREFVNVANDGDFLHCFGLAYFCS